MWFAGAVQPGGAARRLGHFAPQVLVAVIAATIVLVLRPPSYDGPATAFVVPAGLVALVLLSWVAMRQHDRRLCEDCMASMPLDPAAAARHYQARLAVAHLASNLWLVVGYVVVLLTAGVVLLDLSLVPEGVGRPLWAGLQLTLVYLVLAYSTHRRLQPWCRRCGGGGGDDVETPDPLPAGSRWR